MCLAQGPQRSDAGEARTPGPSASNQAATVLPTVFILYKPMALSLLYISITR